MFQEPGGLGPAELIGILAAIVILLVAFGSLLAMGLPILIALFGIGIGLGARASCSATSIATPDFATQLASMIGIGVGIDYALFIVTRYRQGLDEGLRARARGRARHRHRRPRGRVRRLHRGHLAARPVPHGRRLRERHGGRHLGHGRHRDAGVDHAAARGPRASPGAPSTASRSGAARRRSRPSRRLWFRWSRVVQRRPWPAADRRPRDPARCSRSRCSRCASRSPTRAATRRPTRRARPTTSSPRASARVQRPARPGGRVPEGQPTPPRSTRWSRACSETPDVAAVVAADRRARRATPRSSG